MATITPAASGTVTVDITAGAARSAGPSASAVQFSIVADLTPVPALPVIGGARACAAVAGRQRSPTDGELTRCPAATEPRLRPVPSPRPPPSRTTSRRRRGGRTTKVGGDLGRPDTTRSTSAQVAGPQYPVNPRRVFLEPHQMEPQLAVALHRSGGRAVAQRRRAHDDVRGRLGARPADPRPVGRPHSRAGRLQRPERRADDERR